MDVRKRGRSELGFKANGFKKSKQETESFGVGSKSKPCTKFFSMTGCPFGEGCHFLHYVPGGYNAVAHMMNPARVHVAPPPSRSFHPPAGPASGPTVKTRLCNKFGSPEGCKFGDKCHFAHGDRDIGTPIASTDPRPAGPGSGFGASATAKISVDASLAGAVIGRSGANSKLICHRTGAKLAIRDHETDPGLKNIELEGTFEQINEASVMVREMIFSISAAGAPARSAGAPAKAGNLKTKMCDNFVKGTCSFGEKCHFAHGEAELRKAVM